MGVLKRLLLSVVIAVVAGFGVVGLPVARGTTPATPATVPVSPGRAPDNTTYYVSNLSGSNCDDAGPGTSQAAPWCTFTPVSATTFGPGDRLLLAHGATWDQELDLKGAGAPGNPVVLDAYGVGPRPRILRDGHNGTTAPLQRAALLTDPSYWSVNDLEVGNAEVGFEAFFDTLNHDTLSFNNIYVHDVHGIHEANGTGGSGTATEKCVPPADNTFPGIYESAGVVVSGPSTLLFNSTDDALKNLTVTNVEGTHNVDSVAVEFCNGVNALDQSDGHNLIQNVWMSHLYLHNDDAGGGAAAKGCPDGFKLYNAEHAYVFDSILDREAACLTDNGTAGMILTRLQDVTFANNLLMHVPNVGNSDQGEVDNEYSEDSVRFHANLLFGDAGPGIEYDLIRGDHQTNIDITGNTFADGYDPFFPGYQGSVEFNTPATLPTGVISDNVYNEPNTFIYDYLGANHSLVTVANNEPVAQRAGIYNAAWQYGGVQGAHQWEYQYSTDNGASWQALPFDATTNTWHPAGADLPSIAQFDQRAAACAGCRVARAFVAPFDGTVAVRARAFEAGLAGGAASASGAPVTVTLTRNGAPVVGPQTVAGGDMQGVRTDADLPVKAGDVLRFELSSGGADPADTTSWAPSVSYLGPIGAGGGGPTATTAPPTPTVAPPTPSNTAPAPVVSGTPAPAVPSATPLPPTATGTAVPGTPAPPTATDVPASHAPPPTATPIAAAPMSTAAPSINTNTPVPPASTNTPAPPTATGTPVSTQGTTPATTQAATVLATVPPVLATEVATVIPPVPSLTAGLPPRFDRPAMTLTPGTTSPGRTVTVLGGGFVPGETVTLALNGAALDTRPATVVADRTGHFTATFVAPDGLLSGANTVSAIGTRGGISTAATLVGRLSVASRFFLAGGQDGAGTISRLQLLNPNGGSATARLTVYYTDGAVRRATLTLPAHMQRTVSIAKLTGRTGQFGLTLTATRQIAAQLGLTRPGRDGDTILANTGLGTRWYLAEGYTGLTFHETVAILNPNPSRPAYVALRLLALGGTGSRTVSLAVSAHSESVVDVSWLLAGRSLSVIATSDRGVVVERALTFSRDGRGTGYGLTTRAGTNVAATSWLFAEGTTVNHFETYLTILNPGAAPARVSARFYGRAGRLLGSKTLTVAGLSRANIRLNGLVNASGIASTVMSDRPVIVERPEYVGSPNGSRVAGSVVFGRNGGAPRWSFAGGDTTGTSEFLLLYNPSPRAVPVTATFYGADGRLATARVSIAARGRATLDVGRSVPGLAGLHGVTLASDGGQGFVAEQTVFAPNLSTLNSTQGFAQ